MNPLTQTRNLTKLIEREVKLGVNENASWHKQYKDSAWIFIGGLDYGLNEGDIIAVFSQYGEIANINLVRDKKTGKPKGYCFLCYEDQRSTILAVDNFNGIKLCKRMIRVDHVENYRVPKDGQDIDDVTKKLRDEGCGPEVAKKEKASIPAIKQERHDPGYEKYEHSRSESHDDGTSSKKHSKLHRDKDQKEKKEIKDKHKDRKDSNHRDRSRDDKNHKEKDNSKHESRSTERSTNKYSKYDREISDSRHSSHKRSREQDNKRDAEVEDYHRSRSEVEKHHIKKRDRDEDKSHSYDMKHSKRKR